MKNTLEEEKAKMEATLQLIREYAAAGKNRHNLNDLTAATFRALSGLEGRMTTTQ